MNVESEIIEKLQELINLCNTKLKKDKDDVIAKIIGGSLSLVNMAFTMNQKDSTNLLAKHLGTIMALYETNEVVSFIEAQDLIKNIMEDN